MNIKLFTTKNEPDDEDFHITPALIFGYAKLPDGKAYGIALQWGYWAVVFGIGTTKNIEG